MGMFIAVEFNEDGTVKDSGSVGRSPIEAWGLVRDTFYAPNTIIYQLGTTHKAEVIVPLQATIIKPIEE